MNGFKKLYFKFIVVTALIAIVTGFLLPIDFILSSTIKSFTHFVASIIPGVSVMSERALNPARAELTWAVQWAFFPIYLCVWFIKMPVHGEKSKKSREAVIKATRNAPSIKKRRLGIISACFFLGWVILADFGVIGGPSFVSGSWLLGDISKLPTVLRASFTSGIGMVLYAWFIPIGTALYYWVFAVFVVNFRAFTEVLPASNSAESEV